MKLILTSVLFMSAMWCSGQLSTKQKEQVTTMIATATKPLLAEIATLKTQIKILNDSIANIKNTIVPFNKLTAKPPLVNNLVRGTTNEFTQELDIEALKILLKQ